MLFVCRSSIQTDFSHPILALAKQLRYACSDPSQYLQCFEPQDTELMHLIYSTHIRSKKILPQSLDPGHTKEPQPSSAVLLWSAGFRSMWEISEKWMNDKAQETSVERFT